MKRLIVASAAALVLSGCATTQTPQMTEGKTVAGLWASLQAASNTADTAVKTGVLKGPNAAKVAADLQKATALITGIDTLYHTSPATDVTTEVAQATALIAEVLCVVQPTQGCPAQ